MLDIDLTNKSFVICGQKGTGKSWLIKSILDSTPNHIVYDPLSEHEGYRRYIPEDRDSQQELSDMIVGIVVPQRPSLFIIDEANKYILPKPSRLPAPGVADLLDFSRHYGVAWGAVCAVQYKSIQMCWSLQQLFSLFNLLVKTIMVITKISTSAWAMPFVICRITTSVSCKAARIFPFMRR